MPLLIDQDSSDQTQITLKWNAVTAPYDGGSAILSYNVQWDQGLRGAFTEVVGFS
jgi:hypothetical protein